MYIKIVLTIALSCYEIYQETFLTTLYKHLHTPVNLELSYNNNNNFWYYVVNVRGIQYYYAINKYDVHDGNFLFVVN